MADYELKPLQIKQHLIDVHKVEPKIPRKRYEREVWHSQHESIHNADINYYGSGVSFGGMSEDLNRG